MTIINPNSISGITSFTAEADVMNFYKSNGTLGSLQLNGCNFNTTNGISTFNNLVVGGTLTYEDVKNVDSVGIITARGGLNVTANTDTDTLNVSGISTFGGFVGINEASPQRQLHVHDDTIYKGIFVNGSAAPRIAFARDTTTTGEWSVGIDGTNGNQFAINNSDGNSNRKLIISSSQITLYSNTDIQGDLTITDKIIHSGDTNTAIRFPAADTITAETGGSERLRITSGGTVVMGDSVSASASGVLHLYQANNDPYMYIQRGSGDSAATIGGIFFKNSTNNLGLIDVKSDDINDGHMKFSTMGAGTLSEKLRITSGGHVLCGQTGTDNAFFKAYAADGEADDLYVGQFINAEATAGRNYGVNIQAGSNSTDHGFRVKNHAGTTQFLITGDGNVLIGTTSATSELTVKGGGTVAAFEGTGGSASIMLKDVDAGQLAYVLCDAGDFQVQTSGGSYATKLHIAPDGKVGINDTSPDRALSVKPYQGSTTAELGLKSSSDTGISQIVFGRPNDAWRGGIYYNHQTDMMVFDGGSQQSAIMELGGPHAYGAISNIISSTSNDGSWTARFNVFGSQHAKIEIFQDVDDVKANFWVHSGHSQAYIGTQSNHAFCLNVGGYTKVRLDHTSGRFTISPDGQTTAGNPNMALSLVNAGNHGSTGVYPGLGLRSTSNGATSGAYIWATDDNWGLKTDCGFAGIAFAAEGHRASSTDAKMYIGSDGVTTLGPDTYTKIATSRSCNAALSVAGGSVSIGPEGNTTNCKEPGRYVLGWYMCTSAGSGYWHLKTDMWAGGSPHGNNEWIMGGFHIHGYRYNTSGVSEEIIYFHNWGGGYANLDIENWGSWNAGSTVYTSSDGYVTLKLPTSTYVGYVIDYIQYPWYTLRNTKVVSATNSSSNI
jgi:hypothetical protein